SAAGSAGTGSPVPASSAPASGTGGQTGRLGTKAKRSNGAQPVDLAAAAGYLTAPAHLIDGHYYEVFAGSGFADFGLTIDGALALAAAGNDPAALAGLVGFVDRRGQDAAGRSVDDWSGIGTGYASGGSLAKEALLAEVSGNDPASFGGHDLVAALDATTCAAASTGTDTSCAAAGNYAYTDSVFGQALGVIAQLRAGHDSQAAGPLSYLAGLQHADG